MDDVSKIFKFPIEEKRIIIINNNKKTAEEEGISSIWKKGEKKSSESESESEAIPVHHRISSTVFSTVVD